jgi:hypothetical protein
MLDLAELNFALRLALAAKQGDLCRWVWNGMRR